MVTAVSGLRAKAAKNKHFLRSKNFTLIASQVVKKAVRNNINLLRTKAETPPLRRRKAQSLRETNPKVATLLARIRNLLLRSSAMITVWALQELS